MNDEALLLRDPLQGALSALAIADTFIGRAVSALEVDDAANARQMTAYAIDLLREAIRYTIKMQ